MKNPLALLVEDDPDLAKIYAAAFKEAAYETEIIHDGQQAIDRLPTLKAAVILLDMHLPHIEGRIILEQVRATPHLQDVHVIIATADSGTTAGKPTEQANIVLIKPIRYQQLRHIASRIRPISD